MAYRLIISTTLLSVVSLLSFTSAYASLYITDYYGEPKHCFQTGENLVISGEGKPTRIEIWNNQAQQVNWFNPFHQEDGMFYTIPFNVEDITKRRLGSYTVTSSVGSSSFQYQSNCAEYSAEVNPNQKQSGQIEPLVEIDTLSINKLKQSYDADENIEFSIQINGYSKNYIIDLKIYKEQKMVYHKTDISRVDQKQLNLPFSINGKTLFGKPNLDKGSYLIIAEYHNQKKTQSFQVIEKQFAHDFGDTEKDIPQTTPIFPFEDNLIIILLPIIIIGAVVGIILSRKNKPATNYQKTDRQVQEEISKKSNEPSNDFSDALNEYAKRIHEDYYSESTSPPGVNPKYKKENIHEHVKSPFSEPNSGNNNTGTSKTPIPPTKDTTKYSEPKFDSEIDKILAATDPYEILGVPRNSNFELIKSKYRELARKYSPSHGIINKSDIEKQRDHEISKKINQAYEQLKRLKNG